MDRNQDLNCQAWTDRLRRIVAVSGLTLMAGLSACGGGPATMLSGAGAIGQTGAGPAACSAACGTAVMSLTDAPGDFLTYRVGLVSISLKKADGTIVETLPAASAVDLVQLVKLSEIISARQLPAGEYVAARVSLDFSAASIIVDDGSAAGVAVKPVDTAGAALGQLQLNVQLDSNNDLKIRSGTPSRMAFDFNLLASNTVDLAARTVTVSPVLVASIAPIDNKEVRVRGGLISVDHGAGDYVVQVQPFHDHENGKLDTLVVHTTAATTFEINGQPYLGDAGLIQLAILPPSSPSIAFGALQGADQSFTAGRVLAGTSVEGPGMDHIVGSVVARSGNTLTVHGAQMDSHDGSNEFLTGDSTVTIGDATAVTVESQGSSTPAHTIAEVSIGSRIEAFGPATTDATHKIVLDASSGRIRLDLTQVRGVLNTIGSNEITVGVATIDRQPASLFAFAGTGATPAQDSNPAQYVMATGTLDLSMFATGRQLLGVGFVGSFGAAPPDFAAVTLAGQAAAAGQRGDDVEMGSEDAAKLVMDWGSAGTATPFKSSDTAHLDLDLANAGGGSLIEVDDQKIDIKTLASDPSIVPGATSMTLFAIAHQQSHRIENFNGFGDFEASLAADLDGSVAALELTAEGRYDGAANAFSASHLVMMLND